MKHVRMLYGKSGMELHFPDSVDVLTGKHVEPFDDPIAAVAAALANPIGSPPLAQIVARKRPSTVAITVSDITRPVPNREFLPAVLRTLNDAGVHDSQIVIIIGTGMHRPSTHEELDIILGHELRRRLEVIDHRANAPETLVKISDDPSVSVCRRFVEADLRIVTGYIEGHFMAGFSGGRKGVCPALVDLATVQRFHGFKTLSDPRADTGILEGNPCHQIALRIAKAVGVDFLLNVALSKDRRMAGIYCGDLEAAHLAGCKQVADWSTAQIAGDYDLVVTCGGGYPLDQTFYQTVKGMCTAMPALGPESTLLQVSDCAETIGGQHYTDMMMRWDGDWRGFLAHIEADQKVTDLDQWQFQMQCRVLERIGPERLCLVTDGLMQDVQRRLNLNPIIGKGNAQFRAQAEIDRLVATHRSMKIAVITEGPYTMLQRPASGFPKCKASRP